MRNLFFLELIITISLLSCENKNEETFCEKNPLEKPTLIDSVDYKVINSIIDYYYSDFSFIHIDQETDSTTSTFIDNIKSKLASSNIEYDSLTLLDYSIKNRAICYLSESLLKSPIKLISHKELNCYFSFQKSGWEKYYQKYPNSFGFLSFSRPGINTQLNKAIVEYGWYNGYQGGMGYLLLLEKVNNNWIVKNRVYMWAI